jgi:hypothetical protein
MKQDMIAFLIIVAVSIVLAFVAVRWLDANLGGFHACGDQGSTVGPRQR